MGSRHPQPDATPDVAPGSASEPTVSIILPCFNRSRFLSQAIGSIQAQSYRSWDLVIVDDGSTDDTAEVVESLVGRLGPRATFVRQPNAGPYGARNTGIDLAKGDYIAFFDSDDVWEPDYLSACMTAAAASPDIDWVYTACRVVDLATGRTLHPSTFYEADQPRPFLALQTEQRGELRVIRDARALPCLTESGFFCGLQNSVIRREAFDGYRFKTVHRNEGEDVLTAIRMLAAGRQFGYINRALVVYHVHAQNSSGAATTLPLQKRLAISRAYALGYQDLADELADQHDVARHVRRAAANAYFWALGYSVQWQNGLHREALASYRQALRLWPWDARFWKTYLAATARLTLGLTVPLAD